ncbi:hypothetical protein ES703_63308 [subsurface metagenome]
MKSLGSSSKKCPKCGLINPDTAVICDCGWCLQCEIVCPTGAIACPFEIVIEEK